MTGRAMIGIAGWGAVVISLLASTPVLAQPDDEEPTAPADRKAKPVAPPAPVKAGAPKSAPAVAPPGVTPPPAEPRPPVEPRALVKPRSSNAVQYGAGVHVRAIFVPEWFLGAFLASSTGLSSAALGGEFVRRKGDFDLVASMNFGFYSPPDGTYMGKNKDPMYDADYVQFRNLNVIAFDVAFIWHHQFLKWLSLVYGGGLGLGIVLGDIYRISDYVGNCRLENLKNLGQCNPTSNPQDLEAWNKNHNAWANSHAGTGSDSAQAPHLYREDGKWPVIPILHLLVGVNFKINEQFSVRVDGGFHNAFYLGAAGHYFF